MNKEEIKEYLKRTDELELKLTGEDKDTYQWLLFGYNECARLLNEKEQENKELHSKIDKAIEYIESKNNGVCIRNDEEKGAYTFLLDFDKAREFVWGLLEILKDGDVDE